MLTAPFLPRAAAQQPDANLTISVAGSNVVEGDAGETDLNFTVMLSGSPSHDVKVRVSTRMRVGTSTARAGRDFRGFTSRPLVFAAGASGAALTKTVTVVVLGDTVEEDDETVILRVNNLKTDDTRVAFVGGERRVETTGIIIDDDGGDPVRHLISVASDMSVVEGDTGSREMNFTVTLGAPPSHRVRILSAAWNPPAAEKDPGIAKGGPGAGQDFLHFKYQPVVWAANASGAALTKTVTVTVLGDEVDEGDKETLILLLNNLHTDDPRVHFPGGAKNTEAIGTIIDDDSSPVLSEIADRTIMLGEAVDITAVATDADSDTLNYFWSRAANESAPALPPGTALGQARLAFTPPAIGVYTMTVRASDGHSNEDTEDVVITVVRPPSPGVTISESALKLVEGGRASYTVALETQPSAEVAIAVGGAAGDVTVEPYRLTYTTSNWAAPQTVTVSAAHDDDASADADVTLVHAASGGGYDGVSIDSVVVTVAEDDTPGVTVTPTALTVTEGGAGSYTVVLDTQPSAAVEVAVSGASGDASVEPVSLVFTAATWNEAQSVTVSVAEDADAEPDAPVVLTHAASGGGYDAVTIAAVTVTVAENDTQEQVDTRRIDTINDAVLPHVIGALESTNPVKERIEAAAAGAAAGAAGDRGSFAAPGAARRGDSLRPAPPGRPLPGLPGGTAGFTLPLGAAGAEGGTAPSAWLWGGGRQVSFSGSEQEASWAGRLSSVYLGTDVRLRRNVVVGAVLSHSMSRVDALAEDIDRVDFEGVHETEVTTVYPYAAWFLEDGSNLWASLGVGAGNVRIALDETDPGGAAARTTDLTVASTAVGGRRFLASNPNVIGGGTTRIAVKGQGSLLRARTAAEDGLAALAVDAARLRLALEGSHERSLAGGATLTPAVEAGFRYDGGDISEGAGFELGASLTWRRPDRGLTMKLRGRTLAAHQKDRDETAVGALLLFDRKADGRGTYLSLAPSWGAADTGMAQMFDEGPMPNGPRPNGAAVGSADPMAARMDAELGYGIGVVRWGPAAVLRPYTRLSLGRGCDEAFVLGAEYLFGSVASVGLRVGRRQGLQREAAHSLVLRGTARW